MKKGYHPKYRIRRYWKDPKCKAGNKNPNGKIGHSVVRSIRGIYIPYKITAKDIAERYSLSETHVRRIISGVSWGGPKRSGQYRRLTKEQAVDLKFKRALGWSYRQLEKHFSVSRGSIHYLLAGRTYKD